MKNMVFVLFIIIASFIKSFGQDNYISYRSDNTAGKNVKNTRIIFFLASIGFVDAYTIGVDRQLQNNFSIALIWKAAWVGSGYYVPNSGGGVGIKLNFYLNKPEVK